MSTGAERLLRGLPLNPQFRDELRRFLADEGSRWRALWLALAVGTVLLFTWPAHRVLDLAQGPFTYKAVGTVAVLITAYLAFVPGIRAQPGSGRFAVQEWATYVPLAPGAYLRGAVAGQLLDLLFFVLVVFPLLLPAAALEGARAAQLAAALLILGMTALTGRLAALSGLLWLERRPVLLILATHSALVGLFVAGGLTWPPLSPLAALYASLGGPESAWPDWLWAPWPGFLLTHALLNGAAFALAWWRVRALRRRAAIPPEGEPVAR